MLRIMWSEYDCDDSVNPPASLVCNGSEYSLNSFDRDTCVACYVPTTSDDKGN